MSSPIEIANLALNIIGEPQITALTDDSKAARVLNLLFNQSRDAVLRLHPWNFAVRRATLLKSTTTPAFGFTFIYALPSDFLRLLRLNDGKDQYQIEADGLLASVDSAQLRYIARISDTTKFDPLFTNCFAAYLAAEAAYSITNSETNELRARQRFDDKLQDARSVDGMENYPEVITADHFLESFAGGDEGFRGISNMTP